LRRRVDSWAVVGQNLSNYFCVESLIFLSSGKTTRPEGKVRWLMPSLSSANKLTSLRQIFGTGQSGPPQLNRQKTSINVRMPPICGSSGSKQYVTYHAKMRSIPFASHPVWSMPTSCPYLATDSPGVLGHLCLACCCPIVVAVSRAPCMFE
jgi:hypothetical protein